MIQVESVSKSFGSVFALREVSFQIKRGEIVGFLGPNGAGKTTMMRILACFLPPTRGSVRIAGLSVENDSLAIRRKIGYFLEKVTLYPDMRVKEFLEFAAHVKGVSKSERMKSISEVVDACGLGEVRDRIIGNLSKGYRQRVGLAQALLNDPELLLLDEPTIGLDPEHVIEIRNLIKALTGERTVLLSSHILPEVSQICTKVIIIDQGQIVAVDTLDRLSVRLQKATPIRVQIEASDKLVIEKLREIPNIVRVEEGGSLSERISNYEIEAEEDVDIPREICALAFRYNWVLREVQPVKMSLEDIFLRLVTKEVVGE